MNHRIPTQDELIGTTARYMYSDKILNNSHRGDLVEAMVLIALSDDWRFVGLGWNSWDIQRGRADKRIRIQVKQCAALQVWGPTKRMSINFGWKKCAPSYFARDFPGESIEDEGLYCDIFVVGIHLEDDPEKVDQVDVSQWRFLVIPKHEIDRGSMVLNRAVERWEPVEWIELKEKIEKESDDLVCKGLNYCGT